MWLLRTAEGVLLGRIDLPEDCERDDLFQHLQPFLEEGVSWNNSLSYEEDVESFQITAFNSIMEPAFYFSYEEAEQTEQAQLVRVDDLPHAGGPALYRIQVGRGVEGQTHTLIEGFIPVGESEYGTQLAGHLLRAIGAEPDDPDLVLCQHADGRWGLFYGGRADHYAIANPVGHPPRPRPSRRPQEMAIGPFVPGKWEEDER